MVTDLFIPQASVRMDKVKNMGKSRLSAGYLSTTRPILRKSQAQ
jgi:hypothetical protein